MLEELAAEATHPLFAVRRTSVYTHAHETFTTYTSAYLSRQNPVYFNRIGMLNYQYMLIYRRTDANDGSSAATVGFSSSFFSTACPVSLAGLASRFFRERSDLPDSDFASPFFRERLDLPESDFGAMIPNGPPESFCFGAMIPNGPKEHLTLI
jgi:hypothetical protein